MPQLLTRHRTYRWVNAGREAHRVSSDAPHVDDVERAQCGAQVTVSRASASLRRCADCASAEQAPLRQRVVLRCDVTVLTPETRERILAEDEARRG